MTTPPFADLTGLVVDDDPFMQELAVIALGRAGVVRADAVGNGGAALERLSIRHYDFVLCDLNMPGMSGVELLGELAAREYRGGVILFSGEAPDVLKAAVNLALAHYLNVLGSLQKPIDPGQLTALLHQLDDRYLGGGAGPVSAAELRAALAGRALTLHYQPLVRVDDGQVVGVEAFARWQHPVHGLIGPGAFLPVVEKAGLVDAFTDFSLALAIDQAAAWQAEGRSLRVSINLLDAALTRRDLPARLAAQLRQAGCHAAALTLEVAEGGPARTLLDALAVLAQLRRTGVGLSVDHFGTGYSTAEQLRRAPFGELKMDRHFVHGARHDLSARSLLESSVMLAKHLGLAIVAVGVESADDWALVRELGCDLAQGRYIAKPMPVEQLAGWMANWRLG